jgi:activator of HSP90 ATPase
MIISYSYSLSLCINIDLQLGITKINSVEGDALITMTRGKKKFLYDFTISLDWKIQIGTKYIYHLHTDVHFIRNCSVCYPILSFYLMN